MLAFVVHFLCFVYLGKQRNEEEKSPPFGQAKRTLKKHPNTNIELASATSKFALASSKLPLASIELALATSKLALASSE